MFAALSIVNPCKIPIAVTNFIAIGSSGYYGAQLSVTNKTATNSKANASCLKVNTG